MKKGDLASAEASHKQAYDIDLRIGYRLGQGQDLGNLGEIELALGRVKEALQLHEQALSIETALGVPNGEGEDLRNIGDVYVSMGQLTRALAAYESSEECFRKGDQEGEIASTRERIARVHMMQGELKEAEDVFRYALHTHEGGEDDEAVVSDLIGIGEALCHQGNNTASIQYLEEAVKAATERGAKIELAEAEAALAVAKRARGMSGDLHAARALGEQALATHTRCGCTLLAAEDQILLGDVALALGDLERARRAYAVARLAAEGAGASLVLCKALDGLAEVEACTGSPNAARELSSYALALAQAAGSRVDEARALVSMARTRRVLREYGEARHIYAEALQMSSELGLCAVEVEARQGLIEVLTALGEDNEVASQAHALQSLLLKLGRPI